MDIKQQQYNNEFFISRVKHLQSDAGIKELIDLINNNDKQIEELKEQLLRVGLKVKNTRSGKIGVVIREWPTGQIAVLEKIEPRVINTHDSWNTLEIVLDANKCEDHPVENNCINNENTTNKVIKTILECIVIDKKKIINKNMIKLNTNIFINNHFKGYLKGEINANNDIVGELENVINKL